MLSFFSQTKNERRTVSTETKIALYAGSFDPPTNGHLHVIRSAQKIFDKVIVAVGISDKKTPLFSPEERCEMMAASLENNQTVEFHTFSGLTTEFAKKMGAKTLVRGLRNSHDLLSEMSMIAMNQHLDASINTIFIPADPSQLHVSSSLIKEVARNGGDISHTVPPLVQRKLSEKYSQTK